MTTLRQELFKFAEELRAYGSLPRDAGDPEGDARAAVVKAHATRVEQILSHPEHDLAEDNTADMSVTVSWPLRKGEMQTAVFDRDGGPEMNTLTRYDRVIVRTMLEQALQDMM